MEQQGNNNTDQIQSMGPGGSDPIPYILPQYQPTQTMGPTDPTQIQPGQPSSPGQLSSDTIPYGIPQYQVNQMSTDSAGQLTSQQLAYQQMQKQQHQLHQLLQGFWARQLQEVENACDFKNHSLPLARIKKIMKADEDVRMISAEAPVIFARACEMFILELTLRAWNHTEENKRRTLQKNDISAAIARTDIFDFLVDTVPREDMGEINVVNSAVPPPPIVRGPFGIPNEGYASYYYVPQGVFQGRPADHGVYMHQQQQVYIAQQQQQQQAYIASQQIWEQLDQDDEEEEVVDEPEPEQPSDDS